VHLLDEDGNSMMGRGHMTPLKSQLTPMPRNVTKRAPWGRVGLVSALVDLKD